MPNQIIDHQYYVQLLGFLVVCCCIWIWPNIFFVFSLIIQWWRLYWNHFVCSCLLLSEQGSFLRKLFYVQLRYLAYFFVTSRWPLIQRILTLPLFCTELSPFILFPFKDFLRYSRIDTSDISNNVSTWVPRTRTLLLLIFKTFHFINIFLIEVELNKYNRDILETSHSVLGHMV